MLGEKRRIKKVDEKWNRIVLGLIVICITILSISLTYLYNLRIYKLVDAGFTQKTLVGAECPQWVLEK